MPGPERDFPRAIVAIQVAFQGRPEPVDIVVIPRKVTVTRRGHTQADTADVDLDGTEIPFDPRSIQSMLMTVHMGQAATVDDTDWHHPGTARFAGYVDLFEGEQGEDDTLTLKARDLSSLLRDAKPLPVAAAPLYSDTFGNAVQRILKNVPGASALFLDIGDGDVPLANLVHERGSTGPIHLERDMTAWAVIEYLAGMANRLVSVDLDRLLVRPPRNVFDNLFPPRVTLEFNTPTANLTKLGVQKKFIRNRKGVRAVCFDPIRRVRLEADYPPDSELPPRTRPRARSTSNAHASRRRAAPAAPQPPDRDVYTVPPVPDKDRLLEVAQGIWLERSRQELTITAEAPYFTDDWLRLMNGDRVRLTLNRAIVAGLNPQQSRAVQVAVLSRRLAITRQSAELLLDAARNPGADTFYVHEAVLQWNPEGDIGVKLDIINMIAVEVRDGREP